MMTELSFWVNYHFKIERIDFMNNSEQTYSEVFCVLKHSLCIQLSLFCCTAVLF